MYVNFDERQLVFTNEDLQADFGVDLELRATIFSVMVYPDNQKKQFLYKLGLRAENIDDMNAVDERAALLEPENQELLYNLYKYKEQALKVYRSGRHTQKKGHPTSALLLRGLIAGGTLSHLCLCSNRLEKAYGDYLKYSHGFEEPIDPSAPVMWKIWSKFRVVSHLWAAYIISHETPYQIRNIVSEGTDRNTHISLYHVLQIASYFRNKLVEAKNPSNHQPIIKDTISVWSLLKEDQTPIPAAEVSWQPL